MALLRQTKVALDRVGMDVKRGVDHRTGKIYFALVNTTADGIAQLATDYSATELAFFRSILESVFDNVPRYSVSSKDVINKALNLHKDGKGVALKATDAQRILQKFSEDHWIEAKAKYVCNTEHDKVGLIFSGRLELTMRTILELERYLEDQFDIRKCHLCRKIVLQGQYCIKDVCPVVFHNHCSNAIFRSNGAAECPECKESWTARNPDHQQVKSEKAEDEEESDDSDVEEEEEEE